MFVDRMMANTASFSRDGLQCLLPHGRGGSVAVFDSLPSTNTYLRNTADGNTPAGTVVIADSQTDGRGRLGRSFRSPPCTGIYMSYLYRPPVDGNIAELTARTAVCVRRAIGAVTGVSVGIKWVNDLYLGGRKLSGILCERIQAGDGSAVIIGIGINVNNPRGSFPEEISSIATSLAAETGILYSREAIAAAIIRELDRIDGVSGDTDTKDGFLGEYREACVTVGREVRVISPSGEREAVAIAVNGDFTLRVRYPDGTEADISSGEVSVRF